MNRFDLQQLAEMRLREAHLLLSSDQYSDAYYLSGYSVECALKACIAKQTKEYDFPDKDRAVKSYTQKPKDLLGISGLDSIFRSDAPANPRLSASWDVVSDWSEQSRYEVISEADAKLLLDAIERPQDGVLPWIKQYW
jgi:hypothetical protein